MQLKFQQSRGVYGQFIDRVLDISVAHREVPTVQTVQKTVLGVDVPVLSSDRFPQSRGSNPAPDSVLPLSGEHSYCATDFVEIPQVQFLDKVEICPLLRRQVQFSWWSWVVDMPVYVQRQVLSFLQYFHIFNVNVDSDPEAASMECHGSSHLKI